MPRTIDEWIGKTDDAMPPKSVVLRLAKKQGGRCGKCGRKLLPGHFIREHLKPLWDGGENRESNLELWCVSPCASEKTAGEATQRAEANRKQAYQLGLKTETQKRRPFPGGKGSKWKRAYDRKTQRWVTIRR